MKHVYWRLLLSTTLLVVFHE